ncbi:hepatitis A virus cellular receptor 1 homolog [Molossus molossus]|uniref:hepatitis A virus cellular receptor 1 homolog n=1 Tax=Molossus molossus TaxID=27622 RepID=UPI0017474AC3|nr:hepatitis A virus cellular receptor 1 homolog [Molossus molossus]
MHPWVAFTGLILLWTDAVDSQARVTGVVGQPVTLPCTYSTASEITSMCWGRGGCAIFKCSNQLIWTDGYRVTFRKDKRYDLHGIIPRGNVSLTIEDAAESDSGTYCCRVEHTGWFNDLKIHVSLVVKPGELACLLPVITPRGSPEGHQCSSNNEGHHLCSYNSNINTNPYDRETLVGKLPMLELALVPYDVRYAPPEVTGAPASPKAATSASTTPASTLTLKTAPPEVTGAPTSPTVFTSAPTTPASTPNINSETTSSSPMQTNETWPVTPRERNTTSSSCPADGNSTVTQPSGGQHNETHGSWLEQDPWRGSKQSLYIGLTIAALTLVTILAAIVTKKYLYVKRKVLQISKEPLAETSPNVSAVRYQADETISFENDLYNGK